MPSKRQLVEQFGREEGEKTMMVCPTCKEPEVKFESLEEWKQHMQKEHGGYTSSEVGASLPQAGTSGGAGESRSDGLETPALKPKRLTGKARELNDKLNRCISLCVKHLISGITEQEREELERLRTDVQEALVGIQLDFEERMFQLSGWWAAALVLAGLYVLPSLPTMKEAVATAKERAAKKKQ